MLVAGAEPCWAVVLGHGVGFDIFERKRDGIDAEILFVCIEIQLIAMTGTTGIG